ncbi:hypothetical protein [Bacillus cereus group sp. BfR-BA-01349]|uniref:hypothetical protein n=1 Tax=Bacillus cereus group sp. BfR-BA-01349 TaxID=2920312 RepID=UPI001F57B0A1
MKFLFNHGNEMEMYIRIIRLQKLIKEYNIPFPLKIQNLHKQNFYFDPDLLYKSLASFNEQTRVFCHFAFITDEELVNGTLQNSQDPSLCIEDIYSHLTSDIFSMAADGCYVNTAGYYLCIGSKYLSQSDFNSVLNDFNFFSYDSIKYPNYMLIEHLEGGYEDYSSDEWVLYYYEIAIRLAAIIEGKKKKNII